MKHMLWLVSVVALSAISVSQGAAAPVAVSAEEALRWTRRLVPLPRKITITEEATVPRSRVAIVPPQDAPALVEQAVKELRERLGSPGKASEASFTLRLQLDGPETAPLRAAPNRDQAYVILPMPRKNGLMLAAIGPRGLYYAAKTVQQALVMEN
ncbi:MAG TPA: glycoside hydrolase family 20 zincin-like fold domain-containing protein, partial [Phycisphaerae bacterium]|nr:glycoside hydrolase family 20 zincin-like fold domain-containing protein [Phycisphaerae bacterium]